MHADAGTAAEVEGSPMAVTARDERDDDFSAYLAARQPALLRTAYLLTGNRTDAEDLLQTSLANLYLVWDRVRDREAVDTYVRRIMVNEQSSLWRRAWKRRETVACDVPEHEPHTDRYDDGRDGALWSSTHRSAWGTCGSGPARSVAVVGSPSGPGLPPRP